MKHRAFTLVEIVIVVVILAGLAAILFPVFFRARESHHRTPNSTCLSNLKQLGLGWMQYAQDYDEKTPPTSNAAGGWAKLIFPYVKTTQIFQCPAAGGNTADSTDYFFNARLAGKRDLGYDPRAARAVTILSGDGDNDQKASYNLRQLPASWLTDTNSPAWRHDGKANYLFVDGHVKSLKPEEFTNRNPAQGAPTFEVKP